MKLYFPIIVFLLSIEVASQGNSSITGKIYGKQEAVMLAIVKIKGLTEITTSDSLGNYKIQNLRAGNYELQVSHTGKKTVKKLILLGENEEAIHDIYLQDDENTLDEVVISGTLKAVSRRESPVPVEVYKPAYFKKNPTANIFEALQNVNGVRPQLNCNVCNTGDIHINGLEGPYTLVLIDGMPIVSGLSTVYGLSGIPNSLLERIEIVKGPASSLYGSEAVGGLINIITKNPKTAPAFSADGFTTSWGEANLDLGFKARVSENASFLLGTNYFNYSNPIDNNNDNFTDVTLQHRISVFQKWGFNRQNDRLFSLAGRYFYEDRWGGEMQWDKKYRGGGEVYGESIYTERYEILGAYQLPVNEKLVLSFSYTDHDQNSVYGTTRYLAQQKIGFAQLTFDKKFKKHDVLFGTAIRYNFYNDNTPATPVADAQWIPSVFAQNEVRLSDAHQVLLGARYDYNKNHGSIFTPRLAYKWKATNNDILRLNAGTGFRVVNLFTEEHAALTGSRDVIVVEDLRPEKSINVNLNYLKKLYTGSGNFIFEATGWYTHFSNSIVPDYDTNPNQIIYKNLDGYAVTKGASLNVDMIFNNGLKVILGATFMDVTKTENNITTRQILTEKYTGTWAVSYHWKALSTEIDYTGNIYGPMRLPLLGELDPRQEYSPMWSIQNIQFTIKKIKNLDVYFGVKNLLDWTPNRKNPFIIARADDPFDENVQYHSAGNVISTPDNPYALTFDPGYVYGPNQGIRTFAGLRYTIY
ncbi:MAG TPA: TonB-dependent receptor [Flavobacterium sp.]